MTDDAPAPAPRGHRGPKPLGPLADSDTPVLVQSDVIQLAKDLMLDGGDFAVITPAVEIVGLLRPFNARARHVLVSLLRGYSRKMAATNVGLDSETVANWGKRVPEFAEAMRKAQDWGFARTFERELYSRALAGPADRGSMRALELVVKARDSAYREKAQIQMDVIHRAQEAMTGAFGGWLPEGDSERA